MDKFKRIISITCVLLMVVSLMAGCGSSKADIQEEAAELEQDVEEQVEEEAEQVEEAVEEAVEEKAEQVEEATGELTEIGEDAALEIALKDAGLKKDDVDRIQVKLDYEDDYDRYEYEVEFKDGTYEYEYTIDPYTGEIYESDKDIDD